MLGTHQININININKIGCYNIITYLDIIEYGSRHINKIKNVLFIILCCGVFGNH